MLAIGKARERAQAFEHEVDFAPLWLPMEPRTAALRRVVEPVARPALRGETERPRHLLAAPHQAAAQHNVDVGLADGEVRRRRAHVLWIGQVHPHARPDALQLAVAVPMVLKQRLDATEEAGATARTTRAVCAAVAGAVAVAADERDVFQRDLDAMVASLPLVEARQVGPRGKDDATNARVLRRPCGEASDRREARVAPKAPGAHEASDFAQQRRPTCV